MNVLRSILTIIGLLFAIIATGQTKKVAGYVTDASNGETLIGAYVMTPDGKNGTETNQYGYFCLTLPEGKTTIVASFVSFTEKKLTFNLSKDTTIKIKLEPDNQLQELVVTADIQKDKRLTETLISKEVISPQLLEVMPALLGEPDLVKTMQMLPGVQSGSDASSALYVRGGAPDENLILLDEVPLYNVSHLFGFFSVFNSCSIKNVSLHKGGFPARYGGRLSSVMDVHTKDGNAQQLHGHLQVGLLSSSFNLEGPIKNEKTTFFVSARRSSMDIFPTEKMMGVDFKYFFWDVNAKICHRFNDRHKLFFSVYSGRDKLKLGMAEDSTKLDFSMLWGNTTSALRWNYLIRNNLFMNTIVSFSNYHFGTDQYFVEYEDEKRDKELMSIKSKYTSKIRDWNVKNSFSLTPNNRHEIKFGEGITFHRFRPGVETYESEMNSVIISDMDTTISDPEKNPIEANIFVEDEFKITKRINLNIGVHASLFNVDDQTYTSVEPRLAFAAHPSEKVTLKAAYSRMRQYLHLLSSYSVGLPTDLWVPVTGNIKPLESQQVALGVMFGLPKDFLFSIEGYYKSMDNLIEYKDGESFGTSGSWEEKVEMGEGRSKGIEVMLKREVGKTTGWISYTLSKTDRHFEMINKGEWYPSSYDRTHDISIVLNHKFNDKVDMGTTWTYGTGYPITMQTHTIPTIDGETVVDYAASRNNYRMQDYHRLDIGLNIHRQKEGSKIKRQLSIGVFNVYNRHNPFFYKLDTSEEEGKRLMRLSIGPIIPSISWSMNF